MNAVDQGHRRSPPAWVRRWTGCSILALAVALAFAGRPLIAEPAEWHRNIAWQVALDRSGFSPGLIDGTIGRKTELATREFQRSRGLSVTGRLDSPTASALGVGPKSAVVAYSIEAADFAGVGPVPENWIEKSNLPRLAYESLEAALAERFHCTRGLLRRVNPDRDLTTIGVGDTIVVPRLSNDVEVLRGDSLVVNLAEKTIRVLDAGGELVALFHCSIAKRREKCPTGETTVAVITENPTYTFDPKMWPEVKGVDRKLLIPAGPRNPVGLCWIGLHLPGYGIHGSPAPEMIGKTGSHGCFRLTNWDSLRLARMIRVGARVRFVGHERVTSAAQTRTKS